MPFSPEDHAEILIGLIDHLIPNPPCYHRILGRDIPFLHRVEQSFHLKEEPLVPDSQFESITGNSVSCRHFIKHLTSNLNVSNRTEIIDELQ